MSVPPSGEFKGQRIPVCSGTLISAKVFVTAGHCTDFLMKEDAPTYVSLDPTYKVGASKVIKATPYTHPGFCIPTSEDKGKCRLPPNRPGIIGGTLPRDIRYDIGVAVLEEPVRMATYGALPKADLVDTLMEGHHLTTVGYGARGFDLAVSRPPAQPQPRPLDKRYRATVRLLNTKDPDIQQVAMRMGRMASCSDESLLRRPEKEDRGCHRARHAQGPSRPYLRGRDLHRQALRHQGSEEENLLSQARLPANGPRSTSESASSSKRT